MPSSEHYASKRAKKLAAIEAAKDPQDRLVNRDWDDEVQRKIGILTLNQQNRAKTLFYEFAASPDIKILDSREHAESFFTPHGEKFTCRLLKAFMEACALTTSGTIRDIPSVRSLEGTLKGLCGAARTANNPVDRLVKADTLLWIRSDLVRRNLAHWQQGEKPVALAKDVSQFLRHFLDPKYCSSQLTTRDVLTYVLTVNLMIDCNSRISELTRPSMSTESWKAWKVENREKIFTWKYVELYAFPASRTKTQQLQARITFKGLKNTGQKGNREKGIPLRLLPLEFAAEDSLRWLVILGLIDGAFASVTSWAQLDAVEAHENGTKIFIKPEMMDVPLLRSALRNSSANSPSLIEDDVMRYHHFTKQMEDVSRSMGLEHKMLPGILRRGSAFILALNTSKEERCARMGHSDKDTTYWGAYRNTTSVIDLQGMRLGIEQESVELMSSALLNRTTKPPTSVSEQGVRMVQQDDELLELLGRQCELNDRLIREYGSMDAAINGSDTKLLPEYRKVKEAYVKREGHLLMQRFKIEWKEYFKSAGDSYEAQKEPPPPVLESTGIDRFLDAAEEEDMQLANIDPALLAEEENNAMIAATGLVADLEDIDAVQVELYASNKANNIPSRSTNSALSANFFGTKSIARFSLLSDLPMLLYDQPPDMTEALFANTCVSMFNHLHRADRFCPNQEPFPGTMDCRFCGVSLLEIIHENEHLMICEGRAMAWAIIDQLQAHEKDNVPSKVCGMLLLAKPGVPCKYKYNSSTSSHRSHLRNAHQDRESKDYVCIEHSARFDCIHDLRVHLTTMHSAPSSTIPLKSPAGEINPDVLVFWCKFCQVWIPRTQCFEQDHLRTHIEDVEAAISSHGFAGIYENYRWLHPSFCLFCLFDDQANITTQLRDYADQRSFISHIEGHLNAMQSEETKVCPAAKASANGVAVQCTDLDAADRESLAKHMAQVHKYAIDVSKYSKEEERKPPAKKQKRFALTDKDVNQSQEKGVIIPLKEH